MMDANMRHLPAGTKFFASVLSCMRGTTLYEAGVRKGDLLRCTMVSEGSEDPEVTYILRSGEMLSSIEEKTFDNWLVYEGCIDGTGFISSHHRDIALKQLREYPSE